MQNSLLKWLDGQNDVMLSLVERWAKINSSSYNKEGLHKMEIELKIAFAPLKADRCYEEQTGIAKTLIWQKRPRAPLQLFLGGHMDTVFAQEHPFQKVVRKSKKKLIGPGVTDMKGGLAILLKAIEAVERSPFKDKVGWRIFINPDEEIGSRYSAPLFRKYARKCHAALLFEPTLEDGSYINERSSSANLLLTAYGKAAHIGREPKKGKSAIVTLAHLVTQLDALNTKEQVINIGLIEGGKAVNIVADHATAHLNIRTKDEKSFEKLMKTIASKAKKGDIEVELVSYRPPKPKDRETEKLFALLKECAKGKVKCTSSFGVCDGNFVASLGIPTIDTMGASGGKIHTEEEYLHTLELAEKSKLAYLLIEKLTQEI